MSADQHISMASDRLELTSTFYETKEKPARHECSRDTRGTTIK